MFIITKQLYIQVRLITFFVARYHRNLLNEDCQKEVLVIKLGSFLLIHPRDPLFQILFA